MDVNQINAVYRATKSIMSNHFGADIKRGQPQAGHGSVPSDQVSVVLGVKGELAGQIICSISEDTAKNIVGVMMGGMQVSTLDDIGWSAVQEFGNWVAGTTATELYNENYTVDVTPPIINEGESKFHSTSKFITLPMDSSLGKVSIHISLSEKGK
ncbi:chemotaxis protein CheX [Salisediminibacterium beveridgei]|uniref:CheY-P phosphatase CheX n=1 Tax=Salisediminibacterium beveridgei TaxID=632773 RepID=A0A1D7QWP9_9BACI|nr:chemotaxis protein CheX [Salisediminibacterium beveridgei]AOM83445.1 CheY-P phosphatase CheX [Salisediminibacterium beveridgei]